LALDASGNLYFADTDNDRIRRVSGSVITTFAGSNVDRGDGGPATQAFFSFPVAVATDTAGNLYVADENDAVIRKVTPAGIVTTVAGSGRRAGGIVDSVPALTASIVYASALAVDSSGNLFIADNTSSSRVRKVDSKGIITIVAGGGTGP